MGRGREASDEASSGAVAADATGNGSRITAPTIVPTVVAEDAMVAPLPDLEMEVVVASSDASDAAWEAAAAAWGAGGDVAPPVEEEHRVMPWVDYGEEPPFEEYISGEESEEDDTEVDGDKYSRDAKSQFVLRRQMNSETICKLSNGKCFCPFCIKKGPSDRDSVIQHAVGRGNSCNNDQKPHLRAKHAALGVYLKRQRAYDWSVGLEEPPLKSGLQSCLDESIFSRC